MYLIFSISDDKVNIAGPNVARSHIGTNSNGARAEVENRMKDGNIGILWWDTTRIGYDVYAYGKWEFPWTIKIENIKGTEIWANATTAKNSESYLVWNYPDGTVRQLRADTSGIRLLEFSDGSWKTLWVK